MNNFLCDEPPPPPPNTKVELVPVPIGQKLTLRQRTETTHEVGPCKSCHQLIDGYGFAFENYDALGQYRTTDSTLPVNASVTIVGSTDLDGDYANGLELAKKMAKSEQVSECVVRKWFSYSMYRVEDEADGCFINPLTDQLVKQGGNMKDMLLNLVATDAFRFRRAAD